MTNDESAFREVDQAVAEERQHEFFKKNGPLLIGAAAAALLGVGGWQVWTAQKADQAARAAVEFSTATETLAKTPEDGVTALSVVGENAPAGYAVLADLRRAGALSSNGDREGALAAYRQIYADQNAPKRMRELARVKAAMLSMVDGRDAVLSDLGSLPDDDSPFSPYARELSAIAAFEAKDYEAARAMFERAAEDPLSPEPIRQRADEFAALAAAGKSGINLTGEARLEDLQRALGAPDGSGAQAPGEQTPDAATDQPNDTPPDEGEESDPGQ